MVTAQVSGPLLANALVRNVTTGSPFMDSGLVVNNNDITEVKAKANNFLHVITVQVGSGIYNWNIRNIEIPYFTDVNQATVSTFYSDSMTVFGPTVSFITATVNTISDLCLLVIMLPMEFNDKRTYWLFTVAM